MKQRSSGSGSSTSYTQSNKKPHPRDRKLLVNSQNSGSNIGPALFILQLPHTFAQCATSSVMSPMFWLPCYLAHRSPSVIKISLCPTVLCKRRGGIGTGEDGVGRFLFRTLGALIVCSLMMTRSVVESERYPPRGTNGLKWFPGKRPRIVRAQRR